MSNSDLFGNRMKQYEFATRYFLPRRSYTIIRIDGRAFHTYTKGLNVPFDKGFMEDMDNTALALCQNIQGAQFAFIQSDEISILITDFQDILTEAWFGNNLQKMCSVSASIATSEFNKARLKRHILSGDFRVREDILNNFKQANFDSRVYQIPQAIEVYNYFVWRQKDTVRNSIQSVAHSLFSQKELNGKSSNELQEMIFQKDINWNDYESRYKRGRMIAKTNSLEIIDGNEIDREHFNLVDVPVFTKEPDWLLSKIPQSTI